MRIFFVSSILLAACQLQMPSSSSSAGESCPAGETDTACGCLTAGETCCPDGGYCAGGTSCVQYGGESGFSCANVTTVTITMSPTSNGTHVCPNGQYLTLSPDPASMRTGDLVKWKNTDSVAHTIWQFNGTAYPSVPITTAPAGGTSGDLYWSAAGVVSYFLADCNPIDSRFGNPLRLGSITVTVN